MMKENVPEETARHFAEWIGSSPRGRTMDEVSESKFGLKYKVTALMKAAEAIGVKIIAIPRSSCQTKFRLKVEKVA